MFLSTHNLNSNHSIKTFNIFIFQPEGKPGEQFYNLTFDEKIKILKEKILAAKEYIKPPCNSKSIFVAPEYLFKNHLKQGAERYYSQEEKNIFKKTLIDLSQDTDLILAPGTICWKKEDKDHQMYFRNMIYFVHRGIVRKYKKYNPALGETDYWDDYKKNNDFIKGVGDFYLKGRLSNEHYFGEVKSDNNLIELNELIIGIEICHDNNVDQLKKKITDDTKIDIHLIVAAGLPEINILKKNALITIKIDANHNFGTHPKTISLQNSASDKETIETYGHPPESTGEILDIANELKCHRFKL